MARPRTFDEDTVLNRAVEAFLQTGYEATSVDDLVRALGLHRGSLYAAFGSKRGLFVAALSRYVAVQLPAALAEMGDQDGVADVTALDLVLVAALERGPLDPDVADLVRRCAHLLEQRWPGQGPALLGERLLARLHRPPPA